MHKVLVNRLGGVNLPRKSVLRLIDRPDMTLDVYYGCKTTQQQQQFGKRAVLSVYCAFLSWAFVKFCMCPSFPFGIEGRMWYVIDNS